MQKFKFEEHSALSDENISAKGYKPLSATLICWKGRTTLWLVTFLNRLDTKLETKVPFRALFVQTTKGIFLC